MRAQLTYNLSKAQNYADTAAECTYGSAGGRGWSSCVQEATVQADSCRIVDDVTSRCDVVTSERFGMEDFSGSSLVTRWTSVIPVFVDFVDGGFRDYVRDGDASESSTTLCSDTGQDGAPPCS